MITYFITKDGDDYGYRITAKSDKDMFDALIDGENFVLIRFVEADYSMSGLRSLFEQNDPDRLNKNRTTPTPPLIRWNVRKVPCENPESVGELEMVHVSTI
jgi:predicted chitinase